MPAKKEKSGATGELQVKEFLDNLEHPLKKEILMVRKIILGSDKKLTEQIKWKAPSFCLNGDDKITFNFHGKDFFRVIFHTGAKVKENKVKGRLIEDPSGLLIWAANDRAVLQLTDSKDVKAKENVIKDLVNIWIIASAKL
jgi:hypothetical protein